MFELTGYRLEVTIELPLIIQKHYPRTLTTIVNSFSRRGLGKEQCEEVYLYKNFMCLHVNNQQAQ